MPGPGYIRYFLVDPGDDVLLNIESVNILDFAPPAPVLAVGTGVVCCVGEFEDGPFNTPYQVVSSNDVLNTSGSFGFTYGSTTANNPCARSRKADNTLTPENWNGNGYIALANKNFSQLVLVRVDTSVGSVQFTRLASILGVAKFTYLLTSGQAFTFNDGSSHTATFTGVPATVTGTGAAFGSITNGMTAVFTYVDPTTILPVTVNVTFLTGDTSIGAVVSRINNAAGFTFASNSSGQLELTGRVGGTDDNIGIVSGTALTDLGLAVDLTNPGTGNVGNILAATFTELQTVVAAASGGTTVVDQLSSTSQPRLKNVGVPGTGTLTITASTAVDFGFPVGVPDSAATGNPNSIPAGTKVSDGTHHFVTMQTIRVTSVVQSGVAASGAGPYPVKVRPAVDDGTGLGATSGSVTTIESPLDFDAWVVINLQAISVALTESQLDNAYLAAFDATLDMNTVASKVNIMYAARQSATIRGALKQNAFVATSGGLAGRMACVRPPLGTTKAVAQSGNAPGVGATRDQRVIYTYPGWSTRIAPIAQLGVAGGAGFTADGVIDVGSDGFLAALMSQMPPEENPGQQTPFLGGVLGLESAAVGLMMGDYINFKAAGICAPRYDPTGAFYQSGVTSVDPAVNPGFVKIARRRMGDYLQGTCARIAMPFIKQLNKSARRKALLGELRSFALGLLGKSNENERRIKGFTINDKNTSTPQQLNQGLYRVQSDFALLGDLGSIALMSQVGENVQVSELAPGESQ